MTPVNTRQHVHTRGLSCALFAIAALCFQSCGEVAIGTLPDWVPPAGASLHPLAGRWLSYCTSAVVVAHRGPRSVGTPWDTLFGIHSFLQLRQVGPTTFLFEYFPSEPQETVDWRSPSHRWFAESAADQIDFAVPQASSDLSPPDRTTVISGVVRPTPVGLAAVWRVRYVATLPELNTDYEVEFICRVGRDRRP